jgi:periplasmic divalent cation tolerance protein
MSKHIIVFVTASSFEEGEKIVTTLVNEKLAACGNIIKGLTSIFVWKNKLCKDDEVLLILKTMQDKFEELSKRVKELHSYEVPEIIAMPIVEGSKAYLDWIAVSTT